MKRVTLLVEMRCNNYCVYCGSRAIDPVMIEKRKKLGLSVPSPPMAPPLYLLRKAIDTVGKVLGRPMPSLPMVRGAPFEAFTLESAIDVLRRSRADGAEGISLQGGEPSIWPPVIELIEAATAMGYREIQMVTNGRKFAEPEFARRIVAAGLSSIVFSLLGHDAASHDAVTLAPGSFDALIRGIENCVAARTRDGSTIALASNVITSAETYAQLASQVELLSGLGVDVANLHLVRYELFGDDPTIRKRFSFPIEAVRAPLRAAMRTAHAKKFRLLADDFPLCTHPWVGPLNLVRVLGKSSIETRHHHGPLVSYTPHDSRPWRMPGACRGCLVEKHCGFVRSEYLQHGAEAFVAPLTARTLAATLRAEPDGTAGARERVEDMAETLTILRRENMVTTGEAEILFREVRSAYTRIMTELSVPDGAEGAAGARKRLEELATSLGRMLAENRINPTDATVLSNDLQQGYVGLIAAADVEDNEVEAVHALHGLLGLHPIGQYRSSGRLKRARQPTETLARESEPGEHTTGAHTLHFGTGYKLFVAGTSNTAGEINVSTVTAPSPPATAPGGPIAHALFFTHIVAETRSARRLRCREGRLEIDRGDGWRFLFQKKTPPALDWER